jgi:hypothetical protein
MKPYDARIGAVCREQGVHRSLHSSGNKTDTIWDLTEHAWTFLAQNKKACVEQCGFFC